MIKRHLSRRRLRRRMVAFLRARQGAMAVEFAFVVPLLVLIMGGTYELAGGIDANSQLSTMVAQVALAWGDCVDQPAGTCAIEMSRYIAARANIAPSLNANQLSLNLWQVSVTGTSVYAAYGTAPLTAAAIAAARAQILDGQNGVVVIGSYSYRARAFDVVTQPFIGSGITFTQQAVGRKAPVT